LIRVAALCAALGFSSLFAAPSIAQPLSSTTIAAPAATDDLDAVFASQSCAITKALSQFDAPIARMTKRIDAHEPVTIVALGSSSTAGAGASGPAYSYPSRLARELKHRFPRESINVINLGANGEEAPDMMIRMNTALAHKPDLILWQVGTNAILRDKSVPDVGNSLEAGIQRIKDSGSDVLLIDPQFAPAVNAKPAVNDMVGLIGWVAKRAHVPLFRRYVAMRHWHDEQAISFDHFITADGIHMNDWGYSCFARLLADNMATAVARSRAVADVKPTAQ
jgi:lysophospholipase L1-like esterase